MRWLRQNWHRSLVHGLCLGTLAYLLIAYQRDMLGAIPERTFTLRTGTIGLILLVAALACTPVSVVTGWHRAIQIRRALGLYAALFIALHIAMYFWYDAELDPAFVVRDLGERRAMFAGAAAFLLLIPLVLTSTRGWQRRLGRNWRTLHRLIYPAAVLTLVHYFWLDRDFIETPLVFTGIVTVLLLLRVPPLRTAIIQLRRRLVPIAAPPAE